MAAESGSSSGAAELRVREGGAVWREMEGETVLLDLGSSVYLGTNTVGSLLWQAMSQGTTRDALVALVTETYKIEPARAATDVDAFIQQCRERHLLAT